MSCVVVDTQQVYLVYLAFLYDMSYCKLSTILPRTPMYVVVLYTD